MAPPGFTAIKDVNGNGEKVSIVGVLISYKEPFKSKGPDWCVDFEVQDEFHVGIVGGQSTIRCRMFRKQMQLPKFNGNGDLVILRHFKVSTFNNRVEAVSEPDFPCGVLVFPANKIPVPELSQAYQLGSSWLAYTATRGTKDPTVTEQMAVIHMKSVSTAVAPQVTQYATAISSKPSRRDRQSLIKDLNSDKFYDIKAELVKMYDHFGGEAEIWVTDYTENTHVYNYVHPDEAEPGFEKANEKWAGPWGQATLRVMLWEKNGTWANNNLKVGDFVNLSNVRIKFSRANHLEGVIHQSGNEVNIKLLRDQNAIEQIKERGKVYEKQRIAKRRGKERRSLSPSNASTEPSAGKSSSRAEKRRLQRQAKRKEQRDKPEEEKALAKPSSINTNVRAAFPEIKQSTISEILYSNHLQVQSTEKKTSFKLPFVNAKHRSRVRVVDVFPPKIELFAHSSRDAKWMRVPELRAKENWEWMFVLLVEDANIPPNTVGEQLRLMVDNENAQALLGQKAVNLKENPHIMRALEEKLFLLWGNMMELKQEMADQRALGKSGKDYDFPLPTGDTRLQNKPFDCCIEEYGGRVPKSAEHPMGYQRLHRLVHTQILG